MPPPMKGPKGFEAFEAVDPNKAAPNSPGLMVDARVQPFLHSIDTGKRNVNVDGAATFTLSVDPAIAELIANGGKIGFWDPASLDKYREAISKKVLDPKLIDKLRGVEAAETPNPYAIVTWETVEVSGILTASLRRIAGGISTFFKHLGDRIAQFLVKRIPPSLPAPEPTRLGLPARTNSTPANKNLGPEYKEVDAIRKRLDSSQDRYPDRYHLIQKRAVEDLERLISNTKDENIVRISVRLLIQVLERPFTYHELAQTAAATALEKILLRTSEEGKSASETHPEILAAFRAVLNQFNAPPARPSPIAIEGREYLPGLLHNRPLRWYSEPVHEIAARVFASLEIGHLSPKAVDALVSKLSEKMSRDFESQLEAIADLRQVIRETTVGAAVKRALAILTAALGNHYDLSVRLAALNAIVETLYRPTPAGTNPGDIYPETIEALEKILSDRNPKKLRKRALEALMGLPLSKKDVAGPFR